MLLELESVSKRYRVGGEEVVALDAVDLTVEPGEFVSLVGRSGSGKSTLLHLAGGVDRPDSGRVVVDGVDLATIGAGARARLRRRRIGFVFQFFQLLPALTVAENVALPLMLDGGRGDEPVRILLERVGLAAKARRYPPELSGGEMQRVAIARALVAGAPLILADEPTGNLDSSTGTAVLDLLTEQVAEAGAALLLVTHDPAAAERAQRMFTLSDGKLSTRELVG